MKRNLAVLFLTLLLLAACGKQGMGEFTPLATRFQAEAARRGKAVDLSHVSIAFGNLDPGENGRCEWDLLGRRTIVVKESVWKLANDDEQEALIFHELGHCVLERTHLNAVAEGSRHPASLMNERLIRRAVYVDNRDAYLDELFLEK